MSTDELLLDASRFIEGFAHSAESGFVRQKAALHWLREYERHRTGRVLTAVPKVDEDCPGCGRPMFEHTVRTPDQRTRIITCPL